MMDYVIGVSWPRSGHHLLVRLLQAYFGPTFGYCTFYGNDPACCRAVPCARRGAVHLTKNHDFDLSLPQIDGQKYLIQYRDFIPSVVSNYELHLLSRPEAPDTAEAFAAFASDQFARHRGFMDRWTHSAFGQAQLSLSYAQLVAYPQDSLRLAAWWFDPQSAIDEDRIATAVARVSGEKVEAGRLQPLDGVGVHGDRDVTVFRHYTPALFARLSGLCLTRDEVRLTALRVLGREPAEADYLNLQGLPGIGALEQALQAPAGRQQCAAWQGA